MEQDSKVVAVTGASSGIGEATARHLAADGHRMMLGARRTDKLSALVEEITAAGGQASFMHLDVTSRISVQQFADAAVNRYGRLDVMVNNAGLMPLSRLEELHIDEWDRMIDVNIRGVLHGIAAVLPLMKQQGSGHIVNLSSIGGLRVSPAGAVYSATKFAVRAISDGLRQETDIIRVTVICPGVTESELAETITDPFAKERMATFRSIAIPADAVARAIAYALSQPNDVDVSEIVVRPTASAH